MSPVKIVSQTDMAKEIGVNVSAISNWRSRYPDFPKPVATIYPQWFFKVSEINAWLHLHQLPSKVKKNHRGKVLQAKDLPAIVEAARKGVPQADIARKYNVTRQRIYQIVRAANQ